MIRTAKEYGADFIMAAGLTLFGDGPQDCKTRYYQVLEKHFPRLAPKTRALFDNSFSPSREYQRELIRWLNLKRVKKLDFSKSHVKNPNNAVLVRRLIKK